MVKNRTRSKEHILINLNLYVMTLLEIELKHYIPMKHSLIFEDKTICTNVVLVPIYAHHIKGMCISHIDVKSHAIQVNQCLN